MWRVAASSRHLRLYFAAHAALSHASPEARRELEALLLQFRHAIPSPSATPAALALEHSLDRHQLREKVEGWVKACEHDAREFNEQAAQQLIPNLWISPLGPAESLEWLRAHGITHVIDATGGWRRRVSALENAWERVSSPMHAESGVQYLVVDAEDRPSFEIATFFEQTNAYIQEALATPQCAVLVHCHSGVSRSAAIVLAYLMSTFGITLREALRVVRDARPSVSPNAGFEKQLVRYEMSLKTAAARAESAQESKTGMKRVREDVKSAGSAERASAADEPPSSQELLGLEVSEALSRLHAHMGSVPKFARVASALEALLLSKLSVSNAVLFHAALRTAVGNGKGPKLAKLRAAYCSLFDAATAKLETFPADLAADIAVWTVCAVTHGRIIKPEKALTTSGAIQPIDQVMDVLRRLHGDCTSGGSLRNLALSQLYEVLEALNGLWKRETSLHNRLSEVFTLAAQLGSSCWNKEQQQTISRWVSTIRARTGSQQPS